MKSVIAALIVSLSPSVAIAAECGPRDVAIIQLAERYGESRVSAGLADNGVIVETYANLATGSWTLGAVTPDGMFCLVATGQAFMLIAPTPAGIPG